MELFLGQIPEAIFFALFMIFAKGIKEKRLLYTILIIIEYLILKYSFPYSWIFHIGFMISTFITLKILYKKKSQIIDIFLLLIAYIFLGISCVIPYFIIWKTINNYLVYVIINRIIIFSFLLFFNYKLLKIQKFYKIVWNRNDRIKKIVKSTTFRALNLVAFNITFCLIYLLLNFLVTNLL